ncbi:hypothetical protein ACNAUY_13575 [Acinetobacter tibetensis]|uniref:hypothetical protein n=1 Tax=Acinetobacter tibetensis TaxID=2943497 RepID=UPI003A4DF908
MTNRLELSWNADGFFDEQRYYCSTSPIDVNSLPALKSVLASSIRSYIDADVVLNQAYYVRISSVKNSIEKVSAEKRVFAGPLSNYYIYIDFFGENGSTAIYDNVSNTVFTNAGVFINSNQGVFTATGVINVPSMTIVGDFVISVDIDMTTNVADYIYLFNLGSITVRFGNSGFGNKLQISMDYYTLASVYSCALTKSSFLGAGVKNIKFSRIGGVCSLKVDNVTQNLGTGANPSSYPFSSFTNSATVTGTGEICKGFIGKADNFKLSKS